MTARPRIQPREERARLRALRSIDLEDARPAIERIARTAQRISGTPFALVSLIGSEQVWIAGVADAPLAPIARADSFADHAAQGDSVLWIENLSADRRFAANPFVVGENGLRFYAGAPIIVATGEHIGALSVLDRAPRPFDAGLARALEDLAALVAQEWGRARAMKQLKAGEARVRSAHNVLARMIDSAPVALAMTDRKLRVLQASQRWRREMAIGEKDVSGVVIYDLFPRSRELWDDAMERALAGEPVSEAKFRLLLQNGEEPWVRAEITPWRDLRDRVGGLLIMTHEISDMVDALEKAERSEQTLRLAMEIGELSMWELDHRGRQYSSGGASVLPAYEQRGYEYMARNIWEGVHPADLPDARAAWDRYEQHGEPFRAIFRMMQRDGPHVWVHSASEAIRGEDGEIDRVVGVLRNIDKQKRGELALAKARDAAEAANRAKSEFLANMSHEIRTPLNGVMGVASALARTDLGPNQREMVGLIESSAKILEALLSDVLDLARVESGRLALANDPFDLQRCVCDVVALFQPGAEEKSLDLIIEPAPEIAGAFLGDAARVRQILSNLVANAVKFTPAGEVRIGASALPTAEGIEAKIFVKDTGIGFDAATKTRLFGRFEQADGSITRRYGGTGLGLAISRQLAAQMGGDLDADATPGQGACFTLTLPLVRAAEAPREAPSEAPARPPFEAADRPSLRVLLAEDHPINRRVAQLMLEATGVELTCVENGEQALAAWRTGAFDLVFMDMQMPVMDGLTAIRAIRAAEAKSDRPRVRIYALTANAMPEHAKASMEAGADGHLTKPITADALFRALGESAAADPSGPRERNRRRA